MAKRWLGASSCFIYIGACIFIQVHSSYGLVMKSHSQQNEDLLSLNSTLEIQSRVKRKTIIAWPPTSKFVTDYFINIPLQTPKGIFAPLSIQGKLSFLLPNIVLPTARNFHDRSIFYEMAENGLNHFGIDGRACVLRAVCECAEYDVIVDGLIGEFIIMMIKFGPSKGKLYQDYQLARSHGLAGGSCSSKYNSCFFSIFNVFHST